MQTILSNESLLPLGFVVVILGFVWRLAYLMAEIKNSLKALERTPRQLSALTRRVQAIEYDLNNLWAAVRTGDPDKLFEVMRVIPRVQQSETEDTEDAA
jgi:hypothetical protein